MCRALYKMLLKLTRMKDFTPEHIVLSVPAWKVTFGPDLVF